jgi:hypothetical protein
MKYYSILIVALFLNFSCKSEKIGIAENDTCFTDFSQKEVYEKLIGTWQLIGGKCGRCQNREFQKAMVVEKVIFTLNKRLQYFYDNKIVYDGDFSLDNKGNFPGFTIIAYGEGSRLHHGLVQGCGDTLLINHSYKDSGDSFYKRIR